MAGLELRPTVMYGPDAALGREKKFRGRLAQFSLEGDAAAVDQQIVAATKEGVAEDQRAFSSCTPQTPVWVISCRADPRSARQLGLR